MEDINLDTIKREKILGQATIVYMYGGHIQS